MEITMRRTLLTVAATAVLVGGGATTAFAVADRDDRPGVVEQDVTAATVKAVKIDAAQAMAAAQKSVPGTVTSVDLDEDGATPTWDVEILDSRGVTHDLTVAPTGRVTKETHDD